MNTLLTIVALCLSSQAFAITDYEAGYDQTTYDACVDADLASDEECLDRAQAVHVSKEVRRATKNK